MGYSSEIYKQIGIYHMQILILSKLNSKTDDTVSKVAAVISLAISYVLCLAGFDTLWGGLFVSPVERTEQPRVRTLSLKWEP